MERKDYTPHGYQALITGHVFDTPRCAVWAGMGLGKTVATYTALSGMYVAGEDKPTLVLAPKRVALSTWPKEAKKWKHLRHIDVSSVTGSEVERLLALKRDVSVYTTNYDNLQWLCDHFGDRWPFGTIVADESTRLKGLRLSDKKHRKTGTEYTSGQGSKRAKALGMVSNLSKNFIQLTGTPSPNGLQDLWGQMWFIDRGVRLGRTYEGFKQRWFTKSYDGYNIVPQPFAQEQIQAALRDVCITIDAKDWFDLDEPIVTNIYVDLPIKARKLYRDMEKEMFLLIEDRQAEAFNAAARTQKCLQLANGAIYVDPLTEDDNSPRSKEWREVHDEKLQALESIIYEANGMPVLVSYEFRSDLARLLKAFPQARQLDADPATEDAWNAGKIPLLLAHPQSAGHGLNLQDGGNIIVFFGHNWNLEYYQQIIERIGPVRQMQSGHERPVFIYHIIARDTVDEMVMDRREGKRTVQDILLAAMKRRG